MEQGGSILTGIRQVMGEKSRRKKKAGDAPEKKHKKRHLREAKLKVYAELVVLQKPGYGTAAKSSDEERSFWAVLVDEMDPPVGFEPLKWLLLTTEDLSSDPLTKAFAIINWYKQRWGIETFHKILKSGCRVESAQFEMIGRIKNFVAAMSLIAWRLHALIYLQREEPATPCTRLLSTIEWKVLYLKIHKTKIFPADPPSLREATRWIARLGGFMGRKGDGEPGPLTLWRGWQRLMDLAEGYALLEPDTPQRCG